jgi:hypothetical protein
MVTCREVRTVEEETAFRRRRLGVGALLVGGAVLLWAGGRNRAAARPDVALAELGAALRSGQPAALARARQNLQVATRRSPLSSSPMRRLAALDRVLAAGTACAGERPAAGAPAAAGEQAIASASRRTSDEQIACRLLAGDFAGARRVAGPQPRGGSLLLARLADELIASSGEHPAPGPSGSGSQHAR